MSAVKRIVLFKFKDETPCEKIDEIFTELGALKDKIPGSGTSPADLTHPVMDSTRDTLTRSS